MPKRILEGIVTSNACDKTVTVKVSRLIRHRKYRKYLKVTKKFHAHDELNACEVGDVVSICESAPISKTKHWVVLYDNNGAQQEDRV